MAATAITASVRYFRPGTTKVYWVTTMADYTTPTRAELDAGTDLSGEIAEVSGWSATSESIDTPDLGSRFTSKIPGAITADDSSLTLYMSKSGTDVRTLLERDTAGFVVWMDEGDTESGLMDVFPATVASAPKQRGLGEAARIQVQFTVTSEPAENVSIPAAA